MTFVLSVAAALAAARASRRGVARVEAPHVDRRGEPVASSAPPAASSSAPIQPRGAPTGKVAAGPPAMLHVDARRTNRSPYRAPRAPIERRRTRLAGGIAAAPVVRGALTIVGSLGGEIVAFDGDARRVWKHDAGARVYGSPLVLGDLVVVGVDGGEVLGLSAARGAVRFRARVTGDADTGAAPLPDGGFVLSAGHATQGWSAAGKQRWKHESKKKRYGAPAVADDGLVVFGGQDDHLVAVDAQGKEAWSVDLGADVDCAPAIGDDGTIFAATDGAEVFALAPATGRVTWRVRVPGSVRGALSVARDGAVLVGTLGPAPTVLALDPRTGATLLRHEVRGTGAKEQGIVGAPLESADGTLLFGTQSDEVIALAPDGTRLWTFDAGADVDLAVVLVADGVLLVGTDAGDLIELADPAGDPRAREQPSGDVEDSSRKP